VDVYGRTKSSGGTAGYQRVAKENHFVPELFLMPLEANSEESLIVEYSKKSSAGYGNL